MNEAIMIITTVQDEGGADEIARILVKESLAACVQQLPKIQSTYMWKGEIHKDAEVLLFIKTHAQFFSRVEARIKQLHSYDVPEIIALPISDGSDDYLAWLADCLH
ncbi:divalent-cation tolerance protein CutA [bacterium]|nr:divalent-cation tolerance protein CutA [bacterium]